MNVYQNAKLTPKGRERLVKLVARGQGPQVAACVVGVCAATVSRILKAHALTPVHPRGGLTFKKNRSRERTGQARRGAGPLVMAPGTA